MMRSRSVDSWLCGSTPLAPENNWLGWKRGEVLLWWAVVRQAAHDVVCNTSESVAFDAAEWLKDSGAPLLEGLFGIPEETTRAELARLIKRSTALARLVKNYPLG